MAINIVLADDHQLFRDGIKTLFESTGGYTVVAEAGDVQSLKESLLSVNADLIILDYNMPGGGSLAMLKYIKKRYEHIKVIALTGVYSASLFKQLIDGDADGVMFKDISAKELLQGVRKILHGEKVYSNTVKEEAADHKSDLSSREFQVLELVIEGLNNDDIGDRLSLSSKTVSNHRYNLMAKLGVRNVVELIHYARRHGLLND